MKLTHSSRAKDGTSKQIDGIISFLQKQLNSQEKEKEKFTAYGKIGEKAVKIIEKNIASTEKSLQYYVELKAEYKKNKLI